MATREYKPDHEHDDTIGSVGLVFDGDRINDFMRDLLAEKGVDIFRSKGVLSIAGQPMRYVFQGVHMLLDSQPDRPWAADEPRSSKLVFIGRNLDRDALTAGIEACRV